MRLNTKMVDKFCKRQNMDWRDKYVQFQCIREEVAELEAAGMFDTYERELEEVADVLVTVLVYCKIAGLEWKNVEKEFERKMKINNGKPIIEESGVKVRKK